MTKVQRHLSLNILFSELFIFARFFDFRHLDPNKKYPASISSSPADFTSCCFLCTKRRADGPSAVSFNSLKSAAMKRGVKRWFERKVLPSTSVEVWPKYARHFRKAQEIMSANSKEKEKKNEGWHFLNVFLQNLMQRHNTVKPNTVQTHSLPQGLWNNKMKCVSLWSFVTCW